MPKKQSVRDVLLRLDGQRFSCASLLSQITPGEVRSYEIPGYFHGSSLSRQRNGDTSNKILGAVVLLEAMAMAGCERNEAQAVIAHLQAVIEQLWPSIEIDAAKAVIRAQASDTTEDLLESQALLDPARVDRWIESKELHIADEFVAIAALRAQPRVTLRVAA